MGVAATGGERGLSGLVTHSCPQIQGTREWTEQYPGMSMENPATHDIESVHSKPVHHVRLLYVCVTYAAQTRVQARVTWASDR